MWEEFRKICPWDCETGMRLIVDKTKEALKL